MFLDQTTLPAASDNHRRRNKPAHLSLAQIAQLMAQAALETREEIRQVNASHLYATDRDEFVDSCAWQSVNANPSTDKGVRQ